MLRRVAAGKRTSGRCSAQIAINPKYGRILELLGQNRSKGQILEELNLGKSQGYADIKAAQKMARDLYYKD